MHSLSPHRHLLWRCELFQSWQKQLANLHWWITKSLRLFWLSQHLYCSLSQSCGIKSRNSFITLQKCWKDISKLGFFFFFISLFVIVCVNTCLNIFVIFEKKNLAINYWNKVAWNLTFILCSSVNEDTLLAFTCVFNIDVKVYIIFLLWFVAFYEINWTLKE